MTTSANKGTWDRHGREERPQYPTRGDHDLARRCAGCGVRVGVHRDAVLAGVRFCADCWMTTSTEDDADEHEGPDD